MTAPNQSAPDGAYVIGGGDYKYGQEYTNEVVGQMFHIPAPTVGTAIDLLQEYLLKLPIEVLRAFKDLIPGTIDDDFANVLSAVDKIIDSLQDNPVFVTFEHFQEFLWKLLTSPFEVIGTITHDMVAGLSDLFSGFTSLVSDLLHNPAAVLGQIGQNLVTGLETALHNVADSIQWVINKIVEAITGLIPGGGATLTHLFNAVNDLWGDAQDALAGLGTLAGNLLSNAGSVIGSVVNVVVDTVGNTLQGVWDWLTHLFAGNSPAAAAPAATGRTLTHLREAAGQVSTYTYNTAFSTETLQGFFNTPRTLPSWLGNQQDDVAFAQTIIDGTATPTLGTMYLIPVKVTQDRQYDAIKFGMDGSSATMTNCYVGLYDVDETTGACSKVLDLGNVKSQLNLAYDLQTIAIPSPISVQRGELYYIAVLQTGGTANLMWRWSSSTNFTTGQYPIQLGNYYTTTSIGALPSTFTHSNVGAASKFWGALGTAVSTVTGIPPLYYSDTFSRSVSTTLGPAWATRSGYIGIKTPAGKKGTGAGTTNSWASGTASYISRQNYTDHKVGASFLGLGTISAACSRTMGLGLRSNGSGTGVYLMVQEVRTTGGAAASTNVAKIITTSSDYSGAGATRATYNFGTTIPNGTWEFRAVGPVYTATLNGTDLFSWTDTSYAAFPVTASNTETFLLAADSNSTYPTWISNWTAQDLT